MANLLKRRSKVKSIPVFYTSKQVAHINSFSPSAGKPALVIDSWKSLGIPIEIREPAPLTVEEIATAHSLTYVERVMECRIDNGFENRLPEVAATLPYTTGAFLAAAREAIQNGQVTVAPVSGFHHAHHGYARGFCTFNGLIIAAQLLKRDGLVEKVGILDFDEHYGDGTVDIIHHCDLRNWVSQYSAGAEYHRTGQSEEFLKRIPSLVEKFTDCDILLYQAGADPHVNDPLGGWLNTEQLKARDQLVFTSAKALGLPIAWNLAGGYQPNIRNVLDIHDNTLQVCWDVYGNSIN
jgi:acetoin utilization deacetylase AcuC-like enzyme